MAPEAASDQNSRLAFSWIIGSLYFILMSFTSRTSSTRVTRRLLFLAIFTGITLGFIHGGGEGRPSQAVPARSIYLPIVRKNTIDLTIDKVKVIQGETLSDGYQVYIANRPAIVRVFVGSKNGLTVEGVVGRLCGFDISGSRLGCLAPDNGPIKVPSIESRLNRTLNFTLPLSWILPGNSYYIEIDPERLLPGEYSDNNRYPLQGRQPFNFIESEPLRVRVLPVEYRPYPGSQVFLPETSNLDYLTGFPIRIFPVPSSNFELHAPISYAPARDIHNLTFPNGWVNLLNLVTTVHSMEDPQGAFHYYGLVNSYDAHGCANGCITGVANLGGDGGERSAVGWSGLGAGTPEASVTLAHELGHNFGRRHVLCQGNETDIDKNYPYPGGSIGQFGLDIPAYTLYPPTQYADIMSYCPNLWISDYTYWNIFQYRRVRSSLGGYSLLSGEAFYIRGNVSPEGTIELLPVYRQHVEKVNLPMGPYRIELLGRSRQILATYTFPMLEIADAPGYRHFGFFVPAIQGFSGLRISKEGRVLIEKFVQGGLERPSSRTKELSLRFTGKEAILSWPGYFHQTGSVVYLIRYSKDGGKSWQVLALDWRDHRLSLPLEWLGSLDALSGEGLVEVQASDGIHTQAEIFALPDRP